MKISNGATEVSRHCFRRVSTVYAHFGGLSTYQKTPTKTMAVFLVSTLISRFITGHRITPHVYVHSDVFPIGILIATRHAFY